ncbi:MAG: HEAT repeat domain-containing protein [Thermoguttaceae bacterium]
MALQIADPDKSDAATVFNELIKLCDDPCWNVRRWAAESLGEVGSKEKDAERSRKDDNSLSGAEKIASDRNKLRIKILEDEGVPALNNLLGDCMPIVQVSAAKALGRIGPKVPNVDYTIHNLVALLQDKTWNVRSTAAEALGKMGTATVKFVPDLKNLLAYPQWDVRRQSTEVIGGIGQSLKESEEALQLENDHLINDTTISKEERERKEIEIRQKEVALNLQYEKLGTTIPDLTGLLGDGEPLVRISAANALTTVYQQPIYALKDLIILLQDPHPGVRSSAADLIGGIGPEAKDAVPALIYLLGDNEPSTRVSAANALGQIGKNAKEAKEDLNRLLQCGNWTDRQAALDALVKITQ